MLNFILFYFIMFLVMSEIHRRERCGYQLHKIVLATLLVPGYHFDQRISEAYVMWMRKDITSKRG